MPDPCFARVRGKRFLGCDFWRVSLPILHHRARPINFESSFVETTSASCVLPLVYLHYPTFWQIMVLQTFGKRPQALVEGCGIIPERCVSRVHHHLNLSVSQASHVLIDSGWFDNRIISAMRDQYRLAELR